MTKLYLLSFDPNGLDLDQDGLHRVIVDSTEIDGWAHYHQGGHFMASSLSADAIKSMVRETLGADRPVPTSFIVTEVSIANSNGLMPRPAWTWLKNRQKAIETRAGSDENSLQPAGE